MAICQLTARSAYVPPPGDYTANMTLDWATNIDESIGPVPSASDFHPTKPLSPLLSPNPASCSPDNPVTPAKLVRIQLASMSSRDVFVFAKPNRTSTKTTAASIKGEMAPRVNAAHFPTSLSKPGTDRHPKGSGEPPSPLASPQPAPSPRVCDLGSNQRGQVTASKHRAPLEPTITPPNGDVATKTIPVEPTPAAPLLIEPDFELAPINTGPNAPTATVLPTMREPRNFSALRSGKQNPWGSIRHRHYRSHAMHGNFTQSPNPCQYSRSRPLHSRYPISPSRDSFKPPLNTLHAESMQLNPHSKLRLPVERQAPATIFQVIQHPHGISPTKPKITKTVPITSRHSPETQKPISITQCLCGRNIPYIYNPN